MNKYITLLSEIETIKSIKMDVISVWTHTDKFKEAFKYYEDDMQFFKTYFGSGIFDYQTDVIADNLKEGTCPIVASVVEYFGKKNLTIVEIFDICVTFKNAFLSVVIDKGMMTPDVFDELTALLDNNFRGILSNYTS